MEKNIMPVGRMEELKCVVLCPRHMHCLHCLLSLGSNLDSPLGHITWTQFALRCQPEETSQHTKP